MRAAVNRAGRIGDLKSALTSDVEVQNLACILLVFGLACVQYFCTMLPFLPSGMVMYSLFDCMLEVCDLLF